MSTIDLVNASGHRPPRFSASGQQQNERSYGEVIEKLGVPILPAWQAIPSISSRLALQATRIAAKRPDMSMDVGGDGVVDNQDMFIGNMFDEDRDGRLNADERAKSKAAVKAGIVNSFMFTANGVHRITQLERDNSNQGWMKPEPAASTASRTRTALLCERRNQIRAEAVAGVNQSSDHQARMHDTRCRVMMTSLPLEKRSLLHQKAATKARARLLASTSLQEHHRPITKSIPAGELLFPGRAEHNHGPKTTLSELRQKRFVQRRKDCVDLISQGDIANKVAKSLPQFHGSDELYVYLQAGSLRPEGERKVHREAWADPFKAEHIVDVERRQRRAKLAGTIGRMPAPDLISHNERGPSVHQIAVRHGVNTAEMSFSPRSSQKNRLALGSGLIDRAELVPMFSSFTKDKVFREPTRIETRKRPKTAIGPIEPESIFERTMNYRSATPGLRPTTAGPRGEVAKLAPSQSMMQVLSERNENTITRCSTAGPIRSTGFTTKSLRS